MTREVNCRIIQAPRRSVIKPVHIALLLSHALLAFPLSAQDPVVWNDLGAPLLRHDSLSDAPLHAEGLIEAPLFEPLPAHPGEIESISIGSPSIYPEPIVGESADWLAIGGGNPVGSSCGCQSTCQCESGCDVGCGCNQCRELVSSQWTPWQDLSFPNIHEALERLSPGAHFRQNRSRDRGIGYERVMFAPNVLDTAIVPAHVGIRYQVDHGLRTPDRAEYYWGDPPDNESGVNSQDLIFRLAAGTERLMALTQYTMRSVDPEVNGNTTGFGDIVLGAQALLVDGDRTKVATIFRTYLASGPADRGLGTGHTSLEFGLLGRRCLRPETYVFGEVKYWTPIKGTAGVAGDVLTTGWGISTIAAESDVFAFLPTFEVRTLSFLFGGYHDSAGTLQAIDGETAIEFYPGARFVLGPENDMGLWEFGFATGITAADDDWFDTRMVFDLRLSL
ncbi:hypothetical protein-signal peptide prediction [Rhodopirellula baltica SH 1]|uniref:Uncharacterized protein n=1 Tax=Rhodopirellula baltica (strain DSM 10527 / NCIMB 13988 / SH1) TaxID=243090 RepID=Q7UL77_RHOBA|nr:hypothetical protein-signal peptide prediction [Rhodopirellula baltica SH 1]